MLKSLGLIFLFLLSSCGTEDVPQFDGSVPTQVFPHITRIAPIAGKPGDTAEIFGFGFSAVPEYNVIIIGGTSTFATAYALVTPPATGEIESLTFTVPTGAPLGADPVYVDVLNNVSNIDINFTITN